MLGGSRRFTRVRLPKVLLAYLRPDDIQQVLSRPLQRLAPGTIVDPDVLRAELVEIRERGYATSTEETDVAAWGVAAPLRSADGIAIAALGLAGPLHRFDTEMSRRFGQLVVDAGHHAERRLGSLLPATPLTNPSRANRVVACRAQSRS